MLVDFLIEKVEGGKWVGELKASMEAVLAVGGFGEPRGYRTGMRGVRLGTGWEKWDGGGLGEEEGGDEEEFGGGEGEVSGVRGGV